MEVAGEGGGVQKKHGLAYKIERISTGGDVVPRGGSDWEAYSERKVVPQSEKPYVSYQEWRNENRRRGKNKKKKATKEPHRIFEGKKSAVGKADTTSETLRMKPRWGGKRKGKGKNGRPQRPQGGTPKSVVLKHLFRKKKNSLRKRTTEKEEQRWTAWERKQQQPRMREILHADRDELKRGAAVGESRGGGAKGDKWCKRKKAAVVSA